MRKFISVIYLLSSCSINAHEQSIEKNEPGIRVQHKNEISLANSTLYFVKERDFAYGIHVHYLRSIPRSDFGIGIGYERLLNNCNTHSSYAIVGSLRLSDYLIVNISPCVLFEDRNKTKRFAFQIEAIYGWEIGNFYFGPTVEFAYSQEDYHLGVGIHLSLSI